VGFTLRFHPVVAMLRDLLAGLEIHTVEAYAGQHLGGWRPSRPVAEQYSAHRAQGGGVLRDLSHEFDYLGWMLGPWRGVFARGGRLTELTVDADDAWGIVAEYERAPVVTLQLNYLDSETRRRLVVNTSEGTIAADLIAGTVRAGGETHTLVVDRDDMFVRLHAAMTGSAPGDVTSPAEAEATDRLIAAIETSAAEKRWVSA
jgi:predicted dehydrogenase